MAEEKKLPKVGDIVWIGKWGEVLGIFEEYDVRSRTLTLSWPRENMFSGIWPGETRGFSPVDFEDIKILSPYEVLAKVDSLVKARDGRIQARILEELKKAINFSAIDIYSH